MEWGREATGEGGKLRGDGSNEGEEAMGEEGVG